MTVTIELPDTLTEQLRARAIPEKEMEKVVLTVLESWLAQPRTIADGRPARNATAFANRFIDQNRELFEALARR